MVTIVDVIEERIAAGNSNCSFTFLADGETAQEVVSLENIREDALKVASALPKQVPVLLLLPQGISFIKAFFGCLYARAVAVPVAIPSKNRGLDKLKSIVANARINHCVTNQNTLDNLRKWFAGDDFLGQIQWLLIEDIEKIPDIAAPLPELPEAHQTAFLQYTSGSTGNPKGVVVTHENIVANSAILQDFWQTSPQSVSVCWLPAFHDMGLVDGILQPVFSNFHCVLMSPTHFVQKPIRWFRAITEYRATYSGGPNFAFDLCSARIKDEELTGIDLSSLKFLYNGSEPVRAQTMQRFTERFSAVGFTEKKFLPCYGLAEATLGATAAIIGAAPSVMKLDKKSLQQNKISASDNGSFIELVGSGFARRDTNLKIVDAETLEECADLEIGEIWVAGKSITAGYFNASEMNREIFASRNGTRFLRTGDLGFLSNSELFVAGRIKDLIIVRGKNHYPQDIEETAASSHPALEANGCAAFSADVDGEEKLIIVQELKRATRQRADYDSIFHKIVGETNQKHGIAPHDILLVAPNRIPKTTSGKIQRSVCRRLWQSEQLKPLAALRERLFGEKSDNENE